MSEMSLEEQAAVSQKEMGKVEALPGHGMKKAPETCDRRMCVVRGCWNIVMMER